MKVFLVSLLITIGLHLPSFAAVDEGDLKVFGMTEVRNGEGCIAVFARLGYKISVEECERLGDAHDRVILCYSPCTKASGHKPFLVLYEGELVVLARRVQSGGQVLYVPKILDYPYTKGFRR